MIGRSLKAVVAIVAMLLPAGARSPLYGAGAANGIVEAIPPGGCAATFAALGAAQAASAENNPASASAANTPAFDVNDLDKSVSPCTDFYQFTSGGWRKSNPIPPEYSRWGTFNILQQHNEAILKSILEDAAQNPKKHVEANWRKIGDFYASCMDEDAVEAAGTKPLEPELAKIASIKDISSLETEIAHLDRDGINAVFAYGSAVDFKDSNMRIAEADQAGLSLPNRDYYVQDTEKMNKIRDQYTTHVANMFKLLGDAPDRSEAEAKTVLSVETTLAQKSMSPVDLRDPDKVYHKMSMDDMNSLTPHFSWASYIREVGSPRVESANIAQPDFFKAMDAALTSVSLDDWKTYLRWHLIHSLAPALSKKFVDENFAFFGKTLTGAEAIQPRWRRCVRASDTQLGEALGQYYVKQAFPPEAKSKALVMVHNLIAALHDDLNTLDWMSPATRQKANEKLDAFTLKIGYPDKWRDYSGYKVTRGPYVENALHGNAFAIAYDLNKVGKVVDHTEWDMTPPTVNAYYDPTQNEIVFPAGILQPPFFNPNADDAINYGGIGAVIGHEMTHGFDDQGAKFDAKGNLVDWWTAEDYKNFQARGDCIASEYNGFQVEEGLNENGKLVEGESIADLGGLTIAYRAFHKSLEAKPAPGRIDGFTADQRFFLGFGQIWAGNIRIEQARVYASTDPHPLERFRVNGVVSNMPEFAQAFGCPADSAMARPEGARCRIW